jgi:hypothetical protein
MKRLLSKITLLAFAAVALVVPAAAASPVIDPPGPVPLQTPIASKPLTDGWYSAALQQTLINHAKQHAKVYYRTSLPISGHGPVLP